MFHPRSFALVGVARLCGPLRHQHHPRGGGADFLRHLAMPSLETSTNTPLHWRGSPDFPLERGDTAHQRPLPYFQSTILTNKCKHKF